MALLTNSNKGNIIHLSGSSEDTLPAESSAHYAPSLFLPESGAI
jgi:hypothetical protein